MLCYSCPKLKINACGVRDNKQIKYRKTKIRSYVCFKEAKIMSCVCFKKTKIRSYVCFKKD